jgi:methionine-rich copper-binding protein CopC
MTRKTLTLAGLIGVLSMALASQALAHAHLTVAEPAADAAVAAPSQLVLHFNEKLTPKLSGFEVATEAGAKVAVKAAPAGDGMILSGAPARPLAPGAYKVTWHAVTADGHRMEGTYGFTVR